MSESRMRKWMLDTEARLGVMQMIIGELLRRTFSDEGEFRRWADEALQGAIDAVEERSDPELTARYQSAWEHLLSTGTVQFALHRQRKH